ncbi:uncharacterized protein [Dermacentor andersoni]|uniref:uncharacterized protein n=1 Tax=Dermacentor andersoni TaxID=34620 RepID=UPI002417B144|nr:A disintegrin and metalloproteinase with thrombospondin motifs 7-like [Dermacentor andersoni]
MVVADNGESYAGVISAVHEVGHLLGSSHDGYESSSACQANAGFIMSPSATGDIRLEFSDCSKASISTFVTAHATCLFQQNNIVPSATTIQVVKPKTETKHEKENKRKCQTRLERGEHILRAEQRDQHYEKCIVICTARSRSSALQRVYAIVALDGTPCSKSGPSKVCKKGRCRNK